MVGVKAIITLHIYLPHGNPYRSAPISDKLVGIGVEYIWQQKNEKQNTRESRALRRQQTKRFEVASIATY